MATSQEQSILSLATGVYELFSCPDCGARIPFFEHYVSTVSGAMIRGPDLYVVRCHNPNCKSELIVAHPNLDWVKTLWNNAVADYEPKDRRNDEIKGKPYPDAWKRETESAEVVDADGCPRDSPV